MTISDSMGSTTSSVEKMTSSMYNNNNINNKFSNEIPIQGRTL